MSPERTHLPHEPDPNNNDNLIIAITRALGRQFPGKVVLVADDAVLKADKQDVRRQDSLHA